MGLGKTHLMHAIGHYVLNHLRTLKLTYISSERFMNEMINAVRYDRVLDFRERYRSVDVLLVDDIQFLAGKEGTQTEFFHTFNALYDSQKQIVISSDCPPHEIPQLEERLRSRFEWGLIADIQPPDLETKVAILKKKAETEGIPLPDNVAIYIAGKIKSNIRELEGSLIRLIAYASLTGREISLPLAQDVLRNVLQHDERAVTIEGIQKFVSDYYQLKHGELKSRNNSKSIAMPRQIAMYLCKNLTSASLPEIGRSFGGKHHSTVIHSIRKIEDLRQRDGNFNTLINTLHGVVSIGIPARIAPFSTALPRLSLRMRLWVSGRASVYPPRSRPENPDAVPEAMVHSLNCRITRINGSFSCFQQHLFLVIILCFLISLNIEGISAPVTRNLTAPSPEVITDMELVVRKADLLRELQLFQGIVERKNTIPILANVLIEADGDQVKLLATDLEVGLRSRCQASVVEEGIADASGEEALRNHQGASRDGRADRRGQERRQGCGRSIRFADADAAA